MTRHTYFRRLEPQSSDGPSKGERDSTSIMLTCAQLVEGYLANHPGYGYRRIRELMIADCHVVSASTVHRAIQVSRSRASHTVTQGLFACNSDG
jgi:hypothetical protein